MTGTLFQFAPSSKQPPHPARRVSAFAPWLGSKGTMARSIIDQLGPHHRLEAMTRSMLTSSPLASLMHSESARSLASRTAPPPTKGS